MAKGQVKQKMTDETVRKLEEVFAIDWSIGEACYYADISRQTYYNWVEENPELLERFQRLREKPVLKARQSVVSNLWDAEFALKYLKNKRNKEFNERSELEQSWVVTFTMKELKSKSDEDLNKLISWNS